MKHIRSSCSAVEYIYIASALYTCKCIYYSLYYIIIHISLFLDEIKVRILFPSKGFVQWNAISLAYLHSVRVLRLSANVKFACNNVRLFNAGEISLQYSLRFFDIRMRRNSGF